MIKAVFLDVDGTMTDIGTSAVPESAKRAIRLARQNGVLVFVATGRHTLDATENGVIKGIDFDGYVALNGQLCHTGDGEIYYKNPLDRGDVERTLSVAFAQNIPCLVVELNAITITAVTDRVREFHSLVNVAVPKLLPHPPSGDVFSLGPYMSPDEESAITDNLKHSVSTRWHPLSFDIIPSDGGKHIGIQKTLERFGISREEAIAFGDGENDISMLEYCGTGVAMAQSSDRVKQAADYVAPEAKDDGIYLTFKKYNII